MALLKDGKDNCNVPPVLPMDKDVLEKQMQEFQMRISGFEKTFNLGMLTTGIAHELNNLINFIVAGTPPLKNDVNSLLEVISKYNEITTDCDLKKKLEEVETLKKEIDLGYTVKEIHDLITSIQEGSKRMADLVKSIRAYGKNERQEMEKTDIHSCIDSTLLILRNKYKNRINIIKSYGILPHVLCYQEKINQVFMNILINAIQAIEDKGEIFITTQVESNKIIIAIRDTGKGMNDNIKEQIFTPFFTTKSAEDGTGLGLSITHKIIEEHKGTIKVKSKPGEGTEFIISLPIGQ